MSCCGNNGHGRHKSKRRGETRRGEKISSANFSSSFVNSTMSKFCPRFINGCFIELEENGCAIELRRNWVYLIAYSYTLETEKDGALEIIPTLNGMDLHEAKSRVTNAREGKITASATFTMETDCATLLNFRYHAIEAETGKRPTGQVSVVSLGRACNTDNHHSSESGSSHGRKHCEREEHEKDEHFMIDL